MKKVETFTSALNTLLNSWGSEAPPEAIWGLNELVGWVKEEYGLTELEIEFEEEDEDGTNSERLEQLKAALKK